MADLLLRQGARLVSLTGPGGIGKTRLVLAAAVTGAAFGDGVARLPLAAVSDPELVLPGLVRALGVAEGRGRGPLEALTGAARSARHPARLGYTSGDAAHASGDAPVGCAGRGQARGRRGSWTG